MVMGLYKDWGRQGFIRKPGNDMETVILDGAYRDCVL